MEYFFTTFPSCWNQRCFILLQKHSSHFRLTCMETTKLNFPAEIKWCFAFLNFRGSGATRGGRGGWIVHPWKFWKEGEKRKKGKRGGKRKERQGEKREMERKRREIVKGEKENLKWKGEGMKMSKWIFSLALFFFLTTEICLGCTKMEISTEKKLANVTLPPLKNIPLKPYRHLLWGEIF